MFTVLAAASAALACGRVAPVGTSAGGPDAALAGMDAALRDATVDDVEALEGSLPDAPGVDAGSADARPDASPFDAPPFEASTPDGHGEVDVASVCPPACATDDDCQTQCPMTTDGSMLCCDLPTSTCYPTFAGTCATTPPPVCPASCESDSDCETQCPASFLSNTTCCNLSTSRCAPSSTGTCPDVPLCANPAPCVTDAECQAACPAPPMSYSNCCFTDTGQCYLGQGPVCGV
jgi:hypothetical protein